MEVTMQKLDSTQDVLTQHPMIEIVRKWGGANSDAVLDPLCLIFQDPTTEGCIGYKLESKTAIVFGDPIASPMEQRKLALAFQAFCQKQGYTTVYIATSPGFSEWAINHVCQSSVEFGSELFFDPSSNPKDYKGNYGSLVRRKVRHAEKEHTFIREYIPYDEKIEKALLEVGEQWLKSRVGPQMHISSINTFNHRLGKRWFYAQKEEKIVGIVTISSLESHHGYLLNHLMITPEASHGTPELLFTSVLEQLHTEGYSFVTVGAVPAELLGSMQGFNPLLRRIAQLGFRVVKKIFRLHGRSKFWEKFHPQSRPSYVLFSTRLLSLSTILNLIRALHGKNTK
ncbi:hypothetical protein PHSC3_000450 [Chlamydiales bacterium STE3]|nr:hypothetical protein PHSC3_000450 [Chlamydiales bacterium STE3]